MTKSKQSPIKSFVMEIYGFLKQVYEEWRNDRTMRLGAGIAYYGLFALIPIFFIVVIIAGIIFSIDDVQQYLIETYGLFQNVSGSELLEVYKKETTSAENFGLASVFTIGVLLFAATLFIVAIQDALNVIFHQPVQVGLKKSITRRLVALGVVLIFVAIFIGSFIVNILIEYAEQHFLQDLPILESLAGILGSTITWVLSLSLLAILYKVLIYKKLQWVDVIVGALVTGVFIYLGTKVMSFYITNYGTASVSGAASSIVATLLWIYYESQIILAGGQFIKVLSTRRAGKSYKEIYEEMKKHTTL